MIDTTKKAISITTAPLSMPKEDAFECAERDRNLIDHICRFADKLREQNIEVFERKDNVIATESGYYFAYYTEDIRSMEGGIDNPIPFKGKDGRMKIIVKAESGEYLVTDLANLVAMAYCKNPKKYKITYFRDANSSNVNAENLFWVSKIEHFFFKTFKIKTKAKK
jgi:hypothetical protein